MDQLTSSLMPVFFILFGGFITVLYYALQFCSESEFAYIPTNSQDQELEYKILDDNVQNRGELTMISGSIILTASFLIMAESLNKEVTGLLLGATVLSSLFLYGIWLLAYATTRRLDACRSV
jgi:hypothetical protein